MKRSREDRLRIGKEVYEKSYSLEAVAEHYGIGKYTVRDYYREYKAHIEMKESYEKGTYAGYSRTDLIGEIMNLRVKLLLKEGKSPVETVHELRSDFPIASLCRAAGITRAWYYKWKKEKLGT